MIAKEEEQVNQQLKEKRKSLLSALQARRAAGKTTFVISPRTPFLSLSEEEKQMFKREQVSAIIPVTLLASPLFCAFLFLSIVAAPVSLPFRSSEREV